MTKISEATARLVEAALTGEEDKVRQEALELVDRSKGGDSLLAFYSMVGALERLGEMYKEQLDNSAKRQAAE